MRSSSIRRCHWPVAALVVCAVVGPLVVTAAEKQPQRWAVLIAVNDYANCTDLSYCGADQRALAEELVRCGFPADQLFLLHDKAEDKKYLPFRENIDRQLDLVLGLAEPGDLVLVAFSGHGVHVGAHSYLCPTEARFDDPERTMVTLDSVYKRLEQSKATLKLLVIDACRNDPQPSGQRSLKPTRGTTQFAGALEKPPEGILLLASCAPGQISMEDEKFGHGVFMHFVLEGLRGQAADADGLVTLPLLYDYASLSTKKHVARKWNEYQTPALKGELSGPFELARVVRRPSLPSSAPPSSTKKSAKKIDPALEMKLVQLSEKIRINPRDPIAYNDRGIVLSDQGEYDKAIADYTQSLRIKPGDAAVHNNMGLAWHDKGEYDKALANYNEAIRLNPKKPNYYAHRGSTWVAKGNHAKAIENFNYAVYLAPKDDGYVINQRGLAWSEMGDNDKAIADYTQAMRIEPKEPIYPCNRGARWHKKRDYDKAIADFDAAIRLNSKYARAYEQRGHARVEKSDYDKAIADYDQAIRLAPETAKFYDSRAWGWRRKGEYDKAIADCNEALRIDPDYDLYNNRGWAREGKQDHENALADFNEAIRRNPKQSTGFNNRGLVLAELGELDKALADCEEAVRLNAKDPWAFNSRAAVRIKRGDFADALADSDKASRLDPKFQNPHCTRGEALEKLGQFEKAISAYNKAIEIDSKYVSALVRLATLRASCPDGNFRDGKQALELAKKAHEIDEGRHAGPFSAVAAAHAELGNFDEAVKHQMKVIELTRIEKDRQRYRTRLELYQAKKPYREQPTHPAGGTQPDVAEVGKSE